MTIETLWKETSSGAKVKCPGGTGMHVTGWLITIKPSPRASTGRNARKAKISRGSRSTHRIIRLISKTRRIRSAGSGKVPEPLMDQPDCCRGGVTMGVHFVRDHPCHPHY